jgi:hypothetical protein
LNPICSWRSSDEIESIFVQIEKDRVADHISVVIARHKLFGLVDLEGLERVDAEFRKQPECIRTLDIKVRHVMRLIEESTSFPPRPLFVSPVGEFGAHDGECIRADLRISQEFYRTPDGL